jgi:hypothetical protein
MNETAIMQRTLGDHVIYHSEMNVAYHALLTLVISDDLVHLVIVSPSQRNFDPHTGRHVEVIRNVPYKSATTLHGNYFRDETDTPAPFAPAPQG